MRMVVEELEDEERVVPIELNAWQFQHDQEPLYSIVASVARKFDDHRSHPKRTLPLLRDDLLAAVDDRRQPVGSATTSISIDIERERVDELLESSLVAEALGILQSIDVPADWRFVVTIDDLDRCSPEQAVRLLESIKLILQIPRFVFVIGVSEGIILEYLQHRYERDLGITGFDASLYLEKLIQLPFPIPKYDDRFSELTTKLAEKLGVEEGISEILDLLAQVFDYNPRAVIRLVNNLKVDRSINAHLGMTDVDISYFAVSRTLRSRWSSVHGLLERSDELAEKVHEWLVGPKEIPDPSTGSDDSFGFDSDPALEPNEALVANELRSSTELRALLSSTPGLDWLRNHAERRAAAQFVRHTGRDEVSTRQSHVDVVISAPRGAREAADWLRSELSALGRSSISAIHTNDLSAVDAAMQSAPAVVLILTPATAGDDFQQQQLVTLLDRPGHLLRHAWAALVDGATIASAVGNLGLAAFVERQIVHPDDDWGALAREIDKKLVSQEKAS